MKKRIILICFSLLCVQFVFAQIGFTQTPSSSQSGNAGSIGLGAGMPYGGIGINLDYNLDRITLSAGIGSIVVYDDSPGYAFGIRYNLREMNNTWIPRLSIFYGTNSVLKIEYYDWYSHYTNYELYTGLNIGFGQQWKWGKTKKHGMDLDLMYIVTSDVFEDCDDLEDVGFYVERRPSRIVMSIGYRYNF